MTVKYEKSEVEVESKEVRRAPEPLRVVQEFVNTRSNLRGLDVFEDVASVSVWLAAHGYLSDGEETSEAGRRRLVSFREGLRALLAAHNIGGGSPVGELDALTEGASLRVEFESSGEPRLVPAEKRGVEGAMGDVLAAVVKSAVEGKWKRLKACRNEECRWAFYDGSKNRSGSWCDMQTCGSRHKMREYRKRKSGG